VFAELAWRWMDGSIDRSKDDDANFGRGIAAANMFLFFCENKKDYSF
jgi:hypothetical protein